MIRRRRFTPGAFYSPSAKFQLWKTMVTDPRPLEDDEEAAGGRDDGKSNDKCEEKCNF